ncbi:hypothetical protein H4219_003443 [Mycoemilia scoparia]|uniref:MTOR-associated protein MEAK7 n=1 Tax=Mycoemilia scoparia TaxID=417184 RepID=A0A9W8DSY8_9FUNG|nr:hypothetical protein H4219_003443 [Mycoemilia scoparia]
MGNAIAKVSNSENIDGFTLKERGELIELYNRHFKDDQPLEKDSGAKCKTLLDLFLRVQRCHRHHKDGEPVTEQSFIRTAYILSNRLHPEHAHHVHELITPKGEPKVTLKESLKLIVDAAMEAWIAPASRASYASLVTKAPGRPNYTDTLVDHIMLHGRVSDSENLGHWIKQATRTDKNHISYEEFHEWYKRNSVLHELLELALDRIFFMNIISLDGLYISDGVTTAGGSTSAGRGSGTAINSLENKEGAHKSLQSGVSGSAANAKKGTSIQSNKESSPGEFDSQISRDRKNDEIRRLRNRNRCIPHIIPTTSLSARPSEVLDLPSVWFVARSLPSDSRQTWMCLYSTERDGRSWNAFQAAIEYQGAILLVIKEKQQPGSPGARVFGAYLDSDVIKSPKWSGTSSEFLVVLQSWFEITNKDSKECGYDPCQMVIYKTTGVNDHYQYFNYGTKTLPNGLGAGGQTEYFSLWLSSDFTTGHSYPGATYGSETLSTKFEFEVDVLEAWLVRPTTKEYDREPNQSILDTNPDAAALLEMSNRKMYSKDVREPEFDTRDDEQKPRK